MRRIPITILAVVASIAMFLALGAGTPAWAQLTTASISGTVVDQNGPIPGASIAAVNTQTGFLHETTAGNDGKFQLAGLPPGTYEITVKAEAYKPQSRTMQVLVGQTPVVDFKLTIDAVYAENITVVGETTQVLVDTRTPELATNITRQQIENLPMNSRNFLAYAQLAPGVSFTRDTDAAGQTFSSGAQDSKQVNVFIDGVSMKNDIIKGGAFMQDSSRGNPFPQGAVQEYQVITQNYKAEYEKATAAVITAVTKSGGNQFTGDAFYLYQNKGMVAQDQFAIKRGDKKAPYKRDQYGLSFGGPIIQDKLNFFLTGEQQKRDVVASIFHGPSWDLAPANVRSALSTYSTGTLSQPFDSKLFFGKLSFQPTTNQAADLSYNRRDESELRGAGGQRVVEGSSKGLVGTDAVTLRHQFVFSGNAINEANLMYQDMSWADTAVDLNKPHMNFVNLLDVGSKDYIQDLDQKRYGLRDDVSLFRPWHGSHAFKVGGIINKADYNLTKSAFLNPYYEFRSEENWQYPFKAVFGFGNPSLKFNNTQYGIYAQDDWTLSNFTASYGLRYDYETNMLDNKFVTPAAIVNGLQTACRHYDKPVGGKNDWCIRDLFNINDYISTGSNRKSPKDMVQPRLGLSWDVMGNGQTTAFGGWGIYYDRVTLNDIYDEAYHQQWGQYTVCFTQDGTQPAGCAVPAVTWDPKYLTADGLRQLINSGKAPGPEINLLNNHTKAPETTQWTLGMRQKLGAAWLGSLSYANSRSKNGMFWSFATLPPGTNFNDRWGSWVSIPNYALVMRSYDARRRKYDGVYLTLDRPRTAGSRWGANVAYTWSRGFQNASKDDGAAFSFDWLPGNWPMFPSNGDERHKLVMSGSLALPANFEASSIINLGSGTPYDFTDCLAGWDKCVYHPNGLRAEKQSFLGIKQFAYRSVDARVQWTAPAVSRVRMALIGEGFNVFNFKNNGCLDGWRGAPNEPSATFGQPTCQFNTRRYQVGTRLTF